MSNLNYVSVVGNILYIPDVTKLMYWFVSLQVPYRIIRLTGGYVRVDSSGLEV